MSMTESEAIALALSTLSADGTGIGQGMPHAHRKDRHMRLGKNRSGWVVSVPLDVPRGFEPDLIFVEIYDDTGEVNIPPLM